MPATASQHRRPSGRPRRRVLLGAVAAVVVAIAAVSVWLLRPGAGSGAGSGGGSGGSRSHQAASRPLESVDLSRLQVARRPFCGALGHADVERALGGAVTTTLHYDDGDRATLAPGVHDVSHEDGCTFRGADGSQARAWVFAAPVTRTFADRLVRAARAAGGCSTATDAPTYGDPAVAQRCFTDHSSALRMRGLFGDAWLSCEVSSLSRDDASLQRRAEAWCAKVAVAASVSR